MDMHSMEVFSGGKKTRKEERRLCSSFLYSLEYTKCQTIDELMHEFSAYIAEHGGGDSFDEECFSWVVAKGVWAKQDAIDAVIKEHAHNWKIERMGKMELVALRMGLYEILYTPETPKNVVIKETIDIVTVFGDIEARAFVAGILESVAKSAS